MHYIQYCKLYITFYYYSYLVGLTSALLHSAYSILLHYICLFCCSSSKLKLKPWLYCNLEKVVAATLVIFLNLLHWEGQRWPSLVWKEVHHLSWCTGASSDQCWTCKPAETKSDIQHILLRWTSMSCVQREMCSFSIRSLRHSGAPGSSWHVWWRDRQPREWTRCCLPFGDIYSKRMAIQNIRVIITMLPRNIHYNNNVFFYWHHWAAALLSWPGWCSDIRPYPNWLLSSSSGLNDIDSEETGTKRALKLLLW